MSSNDIIGLVCDSKLKEAVAVVTQLDANVDSLRLGLDAPAKRYLYNNMQGQPHFPINAHRAYFPLPPGCGSVKFSAGVVIDFIKWDPPKPAPPMPVGPTLAEEKARLEVETQKVKLELIKHKLLKAKGKVNK